MKISIKIDEKATRISEKLYGIFFEDINYGGDGGLYAELVPNRAFEWVGPDGQDNRLMRWQAVGDAALQISTDASRGQKNPHYLRVMPIGARGGVRSQGYRGQGFHVKQGERYRLTLIARGQPDLDMRAHILSADGEVLAETRIPSNGTWSKQTLILEPGTRGERAFLELTADGTMELDFVSLFPVHTFKGRENGVRADLAQALSDLHPSFMRFPGGCIVEGRSFSNMYRWKETLGPLEERRVNWNRWQLDEYQILGRESRDYYQSYGMGFFEYMQLCEDLGCRALPVLNCGLTCQWHEALAVPMEDMEEIIGDYLDFIEFCNGGIDTRWGGERARMGHVEPFGLTMIGVGNEQWDEVYFERYELIHRAVKAAHPEIELVGCAGWRDEGWEIDKARTWMKQTDCKPDYSDEHYYKPIDWFLNHVDRYADYDQALPKVFAGEYAAHSALRTGERKNCLFTALAEAAFLTGIENAAPAVNMTSYAPLLARIGANQWQPNLIWFDESGLVLTPNYYIQRMFAGARGDRLLRMEGEIKDQGLYLTASLRERDGALIIKAVNPLEHPVNAEFALPVERGNAQITLLTASSLCEENSRQVPDRIKPVEWKVPFASGVLEHEFAPRSATVLILFG